jgi:AAA+ ATPase superfamily predicted ATPase
MDYYTLHYLTIVGNQRVGKSKLIKNIVSGKYVHHLLPTFNKNTPLFRINKKFYNYINNPFVLFKPYKNIKKSAYIVADTKNINSINSIPFWYNKICSSKIDDIFIVLINKDKGTPTNLSYLHRVIQFCTLHKIKLININ